MNFHLKIFSFLEMKFSIYLNRRVFVMCFIIVFQIMCASMRCFTDEVEDP